MKQVVNKRQNAVDYRDVTDKQFILVHGYTYLHNRGHSVTIHTGILYHDPNDGYWGIFDISSAEITVFFSGEFTDAVKSLVEECDVYVFDSMAELFGYIVESIL